MLSGITVCARATSCVSESEWGIGTTGIDGSMGRLVAGIDGCGKDRAFAVSAALIGRVEFLHAVLSRFQQDVGLRHLKHMPHNFLRE